MLTWAHIGDLHVADDDNWTSLDHLAAIIDMINEQLADSIDFVFLPGDNANHGEVGQYARIARQLQRLKVPYRCIPGDHDFEPGDLRAYASLGNSACPFSWQIGDRRCLFLDIVSPGHGGADFRLGEDQLAWLRRELDASASDRQSPVVFMHAYPGDLAEGGAELAGLFARAKVAFVDTGHTHYNELLNDGQVVYAATRSTGQIEEDDGQPGFSIVQLDGNLASWRFQRLADPWPVVMVSAPTDLRLTTRHSADENRRRAKVRARVFGRARVGSVTARCRDVELPMRRAADHGAVWQAELPPSLNDLRTPCTLTALARLADGRTVSDSVEVSAQWPEGDAAPGTDAWVMPRWRDHGLWGTRLGPNKGGRKW